MKILVVDDESVIRRALRRALEKEGFEVLEAENGEEGLEKWKQHGPDLVFLDVLMPKLSGFEVLKEMEGQKGVTKVILMSAYSGSKEVQKIETLGADRFLSKPFNDIFQVVKIAKELLDD